MIQAQELRIGNWVMDRGNKKWQIDCWESSNKVAAKMPYLGDVIGMTMYGHPLTEDVEYLNPIPITPEILEKCGFVKDNSYGHPTFVEKYHVELNQHLSVTFIHNEWRVFDIAPNLELNSLHQLQNLYFALTGEELTVNL